MSNASVVVLVSGGLDSTVLAHWLARSGQILLPVFINYGHHSAATELATVHAVLPDRYGPATRVIDLTSVFSGSRSRLVTRTDLWRETVDAEQLVLPYRNALLLTAAAAYASANSAAAVYAAFINSNHALEIDATHAFLTGIGSFAHDVGGVQLRFPFRDFPKATVARLGLELEVPIARTYSCLVNPTVHCGACPNCRDRLAAIAEATRQWDGTMRVYNSLRGV